MTITEVADTLGVNIRHIRRLVHERRIPYIKWGHLLRFDPTDIAAWVDAYRRYPRGHRYTGAPRGATPPAAGTTGGPTPTRTTTSGSTSTTRATSA
jgi:excisionase family DNA binding protein